MTTGAAVARVPATSPPLFSFDPVAFVLHLVDGGVLQFVTSARESVDTVLATYLFGTYDITRPGTTTPLTADPAIIQLNRLLADAGTVLLVAVFLYSCLRTVIDHHLDVQHTLQVVLPRLLLAVVLMDWSLPLIQLAVDLENALCGLVAGNGAVAPANLPWANPLAGPALQAAADNLFLLVLSALMVLALLLLALAYVVRATLLVVLCVVAPLAALLHVLPETRSQSRQWMRLFVATLFMQFVQLLVLRVAVTLTVADGQSLVSILYALACLYLMLRVPGALGSAAHWQRRAAGAGRRLERSARRLLLARLEALG
ncbi:MAG TPA: conjugal transfer protein TrbL family protein [Verrucomicrobiae bacterium]|nr:conjugal transfer protein TrbL family protein [Verrucomicrobiae bacterium]